MEQISTRDLKTTESFKFFIECKLSQIPSDKALARAINSDLIEKDDLVQGQLNLIRYMAYFDFNPSSFMSEKDRLIYEEKRLKQDYFTGFNFLRHHFGLRKGSIHLFLGDSGKGKSTLIRSIALENAIKHSSLILLSEETSDSYKFKLSESAVAMNHLKGFSVECLNRISIASELSLDFDAKRDFKKFFDMISSMIKRQGANLFIYDNFSTGLFSEDFELQKMAMKAFKEIANKFQIPIIIVCHPTKGASLQNLYLTHDHVRGNNSLASMPEYFYTLNVCEQNGEIRTFLYTDKARDYDKARGLWFELLYKNTDQKCGHYYSDRKIDQRLVLEILKKAKK